jgi:integrase
MEKKNDEEHFELGRDPMDPIRSIIGLERPLHAILHMIESMLLVMLPESAPPVKRAIQFRNILLVALLSANPLRIRQFAIMEFDRHLIRQDDGSWWLQFKKHEFKNRRSLKADYRVRVEEHVWPLIERYRAEFRPHLDGADSCKYVFRPYSGKEENVSPMGLTALQSTIIELTHLYIPNCPGFGPHGFRHIVATDIIKANPRLGFFLAAKVLHDKLETVEEDYAHLKTCELFEPYNIHYAEAWRSVISEIRGGAWACLLS